MSGRKVQSHVLSSEVTTNVSEEKKASPLYRLRNVFLPDHFSAKK